MIEIIPFNKDLFDNFNIGDIKLTRYTYINNTELVNKLTTIDLPIANRRIALRNIFEFLTYIDTELNNNDNTIIVLDCRVIETFFSRKKYKQYMDLFAELGVMTKVPYTDGTFYKAGTLYSQYRVHTQYIKDEDLSIIVLEDDRAKNKFVCEVPDLDYRYKKTIGTMKINIPLAIEAEIRHCRENNLSVRNLRSRISRIFYTLIKRFIKKGKKVDRIYHSFTNLSRVSRKYFNISLNEIDIVNCQPLLLVALLEKNGYDYDVSYKIDCEAGCFYERFIDINKPDDISEYEWRNTYTKQSLYKNIFFGFAKNNKTNKRFKELYPKTWLALEMITESGVSLASQLQNLESNLFNNLIPKRSKNYFTLFDAIYYDDLLDRPKLENTIKDYFKQYGIQVALK